MATKAQFNKTEDTELDEAGLVSKATLKRYRDKSKKDFRAKGGINAALEKQDKEKKVEVRKEDMDEGDGPHSVEFYDARERKAKAKWHYDRAGKQKGASLSKGIKHDYEAELLKRGAKDSNGNQTPLRKEEVELAEISARTLAVKVDPYADTTPKVKKPKKKKLSKESMDIVDAVMVTETPEDASTYIAAMEVRMNDIVSEIKNELKVSMFDFAGVTEARKPKPGSPGGSWVDRDVAEKFKKEGKEKKQFAGAKREIDKLKKQGK